MKVSTINHKDPSPLYLQVKDFILGEIKSGRYGIDCLIPSENELVRAYGVSQGTVRRALLELVKDGYLYRRQGKGTFVSSRWIESNVEPSFVKFFFPMFEEQDQIFDRHHKELARGIQSYLSSISGGYEMLIDIVLDERKPGGLVIQETPFIKGAFFDLLNPVNPEILRKLTTPCVTIHRHIPGIPGIRIDNSKGAESVIKHLVEYGHRRIGFLKNRQDYADTQERFTGYLAALADNGLPYEEEMIMPSSWHGEGAYLAAEKLLSLPKPPSAIFAPGWQMALGVLKAAKDKGVDVPGDLAVVAFDDLTELYKPRVPLTTIKQPVFEMGEKAAKMLIDLVDGERAGSEHITLQPQLIIRRSTTG